MKNFLDKILNSKLFILICLFSLSESLCLAQPSVFLDKVDTTPDLTQTDPRGKFAENGINYCAPVAVSNSFVWLSEHGYPKLLPNVPKGESTNIVSRQLSLVKILGSSDYMDTKADEGTYVDNVLLGIKKYVLKQGYSIKNISYQGFRSNLAEFDGGARSPRLASLKQGLIGKSAVWLNIGWYQHNPNSGTYVRVGGHWITLVGYGIDKDNKHIDNGLIVHNPSPRSGNTFHNDFVSLVPVQGVLVSRRGLLGFPRPAWGFYKIVGDLVPLPGSDTVILESAVILELY
jgi:hypothetical protein